MPHDDGRAEAYLVVEAEPGEALLPRLAGALATSRAPSLLIVAPPGGALAPQTCKAIIDLAQARGTAALIADDARLARTLKADGVHLAYTQDPMKAYEEARSILGERYIVGADAGRSRHDAMVLGEAGADYISFGAPPRLADQAKAKERRLDLVAWWSELMQVPVVAFDASSPEEAAQLGQAGADFVALELPASSETSDSERFAAMLGAVRGNVISAGKSP